MKWTIEYFENEDYFRLVSTGLYEAGDLVAMFTDMFAHPLWRTGTPILMDRRGVDYRSVTYDVIRRAIRDLEARPEATEFSRIAYLVGTTAAFGVSRQIQNLMEDSFTGMIEVFTDEAAAVRWLTESRGQ